MLKLDDLSVFNNDIDTDDWFDQVKEISHSLGFEKVLFGLARNNQQDCTAVFIADNYPHAWRTHYDNAKYSTVDPVVIHSSIHTTPLVWSDGMYNNPVQQILREEAAAHGLKHGVSLPMHGPGGVFGVFSFSLDAENTESAHRHVSQQISNLVLLRDIALQIATAFVFESDNAVCRLTKQEQEILRWCSRGKTSWEISVIQGCSEANINFHIGKINRKFGVKTRRAAVLLAMNAGLIQP